MLDREILLDNSELLNIALARKGYSYDEYISVVEALEKGDRTILDSVRKSQDSLVGTIPSTQEEFKDGNGEYTSERKYLHKALINLKTKNKTPQNVPTLSIFAGPPGAGKSTLRSSILPDYNNFVSTDPDTLRPYLYYGYDEERPETIIATKDEAFDIAQELTDYCFDNKLSIVCESTLRDLTWVEVAIERAKQNGYQVRIDYIHRPLSECFYNDIFKRRKSVPLELFFDSIEGYHNFHTLFINTDIESIAMYDASGVYTDEITEIVSRKCGVFNVNNEKLQGISSKIDNFYE